MRDNEIIKALECCIDSSTVLACADCPLLDTRQCIGKPKTYVSNFIVEKGINLINRQQAEIERLQKEKTEQQLRKEMLRLTVEEVKTEAIKEFAERYKKEIFSITHFNGYVYSGLVLSVFDNLVKEMTEVSK